MGREREAVLFSPLVWSVRLGHDLRSHLEVSLKQLSNI